MIWVLVILTFPSLHREEPNQATCLVESFRFVNTAKVVVESDLSIDILTEDRATQILLRDDLLTVLYGGPEAEIILMGIQDGMFLSIEIPIELDVRSRVSRLP